MIILGITGGMGTGKSVVSQLLQIMNIPVYIADKESKKITQTSPRIREKLISRFGTCVYENDQLNKPLLASLIFGNDENLQFVNSIIHPEVLVDFLEWSKMQEKSVVAIESAILFESGFHANVDKILLVTAPLELRYERVLKRNHITREEIIRRMESQLPDSPKITQSDFLVTNDDLQALIPQIETIARVLEVFKM